MNKQILFLLFFLISFNSTSQVPTNTISIIPQPVHILKGTGHFTFPKEVLIHAPDSPELVKTISILSERLSLPTGNHVTFATSSNGATIKLLLNDSDDSQLGKEGYTLSVTHTGIKIKANKLHQFSLKITTKN